MSKLNPQIGKVQIGIREKDMELLEIYPLSIADQITMSDMITAAVQKFMGISEDSVDDAANDMEDMAVVSFIIDLIKTNITKVLSLVTDYSTVAKAEKLLPKITNNQAVDICTLIYEMNYEDSSKNAVGLFKRVTGNLKEMVPATKTSLTRPLQQSLKNIPNSDLNISSISATEKEA